MKIGKKLERKHAVEQAVDLDGAIAWKIYHELHLFSYLSRLTKGSLLGPLERFRGNCVEEDSFIKKK